MKISIVAAVAENGVIGRDGALPWRLPDDQRFFRKLTTGHCLVMGRRTWESIGGPLPERTSIVLSRDPSFAAAEAIAVRDFDAALCAARARGERELFVVGGAAVYAAALPRADTLHLTRVHARVEGDTHFPAFSPSAFELVAETPHPADARHDHAFTIQKWVRR